MFYVKESGTVELCFEWENGCEDPHTFGDTCITIWYERSGCTVILYNVSIDGKLKQSQTVTLPPPCDWNFTTASHPTFISVLQGDPCIDFTLSEITGTVTPYDFADDIGLSERHIYGTESHGRFAMDKPKNVVYDDVLHDERTDLYPGNKYNRTGKEKEYFLFDHLGNVTMVMGDIKKKDVLLSTAHFVLDVHSISNYYPFGMLMPNRTYEPKGQRYGFNGKERDNELKGTGNSYDFGARMYDSRLGRWMSMDPLYEDYPGISPYAFALNTPVNATDPDGRLVLFFNGYNADGTGGTSRYWQGFDDKVMKKLGDNSAIYYDGSMGGGFSLTDIDVKIVPKIVSTEVFGYTLSFPVGISDIKVTTGTNLSGDARYKAGVQKGKEEADRIFNLLDKTQNPDGTYTFHESIKAFSHSMGTAFDRGFIDALQMDERFTNVLFETSVDIDAYMGFQWPADLDFDRRLYKAGGYGLNWLLPGNTADVRNAEKANSPEDNKAGHGIDGYTADGIPRSKQNNTDPKDKGKIDTGSGATPTAVSQSKNDKKAGE